MRILSLALAGALAIGSLAAATPADAQHHGGRGWHGGGGYHGGGGWRGGGRSYGHRGGYRHYGWRGGYRRVWGGGLRCRTVWRWGEPHRRCWRAW